MNTLAGHTAASPLSEGVTEPRRTPERPISAPSTAIRIANLGNAPSLDACLAAYGLELPGIQADQARRAIAHWLRSWAGFGMDADDLAEQVAA